jgi:hypothetical protein
VIAYSVRRLPYVVRSASAGFQQVSPALEEAAQNMGATPERALWRITLPLVAPNLVAGGLLAFAFAMLEVSDSMILAQQAAHFPITKAIYTLIGALGSGPNLGGSAGGVGDGVFDGDDRGGGDPVGEKDGGAVSGVRRGWRRTSGRKCGRKNPIAARSSFLCLALLFGN